MSDIFISYSRFDIRLVEKLKDFFITNGKDAWIDWESIPYSAVWWDEIKLGIEHADNFMIILSPNSMSSPVTHLELEYAIQLNKRIIPVLLEFYEREDCILRITKSIINSSMRSQIVIDLWNQKSPQMLFDYNDSFIMKINFFRINENLDLKGLLDIIHKDSFHVRQHTNILRRALEWEQSEYDNSLLMSGVTLRNAKLWLQEALHQQKPPYPTDLHKFYIETSEERELGSKQRNNIRRKKIFISYRRDDSEYAAGRIFDRLASSFGKKNIFLDVDSIDYGTDFNKFIQKTLEECFVVLVIIGPRWLSILNERSRNPETDFVRIEVENALADSGLKVIPIFLRNAHIASSRVLPLSMRQLMLKNGIYIRPGRDFHQDMNLLIRELKQSKK